MSPSRSLLVGILGLLVPPLALAEELARRTLAECIALAVQQQPTLRAATASVEAGRERVWETAAAYLPQVSATYTATRRQTSPGALTGANIAGRSQTFNFYATGVGFSQILFDFGQNLALIHAAQASAEALAADEQTQHDTVIFNVEQAYFTLLAAYRLRDVADQTVEQNRKHLETAQGRFDVGLAARFDVTQAQVQLASAELNQVTARNNVSLARETLRNALGIMGPLDFDIVDELEQPAPAVKDSEALDLAYGRRPELRSMVAQERSQSERISALERDYLPKVSSGGAYDWSGARYPLQPNWNLGAAVNLSVFNGGLTTAQIGEARANLKNLRFTEEQLRQNITLQVQQAVLNVHQAVESIRVANKGLQEARENLDIAEGRYATGVGTIIELTDAQTSLASAAANRVQALVNHFTALAALEWATASPFVPGRSDGT